MEDIVDRIDAEVQDFAMRTRFFHEPMTPGRARNFVRQHRLNTRHRNSVLKLKVATNCPVWDVRLQIIDACSQEVIGDHEHGGGRAHWEILEALGVYIGMDLERDIRSAEPLPSTQMCWNAWNGLMATTHWLEGLIANTCAERSNIPGYGTGIIREAGWFGTRALGEIVFSKRRSTGVLPCLSGALRFSIKGAKILRIFTCPLVAA